MKLRLEITTTQEKKKPSKIRKKGIILQSIFLYLEAFLTLRYIVICSILHEGQDIMEAFFFPSSLCFIVCLLFSHAFRLLLLSRLDDEELTCNVCDRAFSSPRQLEYHQQKKRHWGYVIWSICVRPLLSSPWENRAIITHDDVLLRGYASQNFCTSTIYSLFISL